MDEGLRAQIEAYLPHLDHLIERGRQLRDALMSAPPSVPAIAPRMRDGSTRRPSATPAKASAAAPVDPTAAAIVAHSA